MWLIARSSYSIPRLTGACRAGAVPPRRARTSSPGSVPGLPRQHGRGVLGVLEFLGGGSLLQGAQAQEVGHRYDDCGLAAEMDHLIWSGIRAGICWLSGAGASCRDRRGLLFADPAAVAAAVPP